MRNLLESWDMVRLRLRNAKAIALFLDFDGTLAPCFPMYAATHDWGVVGDHRFEKRQLDTMKETCQKHCYSTLNHNLAYCYKASRAIKWVLKQAAHGFQGTTGSFDD